MSCTKCPVCKDTVVSSHVTGCSKCIMKLFREINQRECELFRTGLSMIEDTIYTIDNMQPVWIQFHRNPQSVVWSDDQGQTWNGVPSMDNGGKWALFTVKEGQRVDWQFKIQNNQVGA